VGGVTRLPALYEKSRETPEAAYRNIGLEGQWFYTAHSRSKVSGWTVATGVPVEDVERELRGSTIAMTGGAALTVAARRRARARLRTTHRSAGVCARRRGHGSGAR